MRPSTGTGRLLWHALGPKTIELIHEHVHVDAIRDDLETLVLDADLLEAVLGAPDPGKKAKEIEIKVSRVALEASARPSGSKSLENGWRRSRRDMSGDCSRVLSS